MKEKLLELIGDKLDKLNIFIYDAFYEEEGNSKYLRIVLDSKEIIPLNIVVMATRIINPIIDKANIIEEECILDIYAKSKGDDYNG